MKRFSAIGHLSKCSPNYAILLAAFHCCFLRHYQCFLYCVQVCDWLVQIWQLPDHLLCKIVHVVLGIESDPHGDVLNWHVGMAYHPHEIFVSCSLTDVWQVPYGRIIVSEYRHLWFLSVRWQRGLLNVKLSFSAFHRCSRCRMLNRWWRNLFV